MVQYRQFRNTDAPALAQIWNACLPGRSAVRLVNSTPLEERVFAKLYFDPAGLIIAEDSGGAIGFAHAGFGPSSSGAELDTASGVLCMIGVRPEFHRRGIGSELLRRAEEYLRQRGAREVYAGPHWPRDPFYFGLYGGSGAPGFLTSDPAAEPFLLRRRYAVSQSFRVWQRRLSAPIRITDPRLAAHRQRYDLRMMPRQRNTWWNECVFDLLETMEFVLQEKTSQTVRARARVWEMTGYSQRWGVPSVGVLDVHVDEPVRRQGLGKLLVALLLRYLQEQFFEIVEMQTDQANEPAAALLRGLGFELVDSGRVYKKQD